MPTYHAVVWIDASEAHVLMFDREHMDSRRIKARSHHKHRGRDELDPNYFPAVASALAGTHEVLLTGPGSMRNELLAWCLDHQPFVARSVVDSIASDHPSDAQLVALARAYFMRHDRMRQDPSLR